MNIFDEYKFNSITELIRLFDTEEKCEIFFEKVFWNGNPISPYDATAKVYRCKGRYKCAKTKKYFSIKSISIFKNSKVKLSDWIVTMWYYNTHKGGISSMLLSRELGISQKTAWFILKRLKECSKFENNHILSNEVEIDETYIGGKNKNRHKNKRVKNSQGRSSLDKVPVLGMVERGGKLCAKIVSSVNKEVLENMILQKINIFSTVYTDEFKSYNGLIKYFSHTKVNHSAGQYVDGKTHTNTIENFWSNLKRGIIGIYRYVSKKHLQSYIDEFVFRYNTRKLNQRIKFFHLVQHIKGIFLSYKQAII